MKPWTKALITAGLLSALADPQAISFNPKKAVEKVAKPLVQAAVTTVQVTTAPVAAQVQAAVAVSQVATGESAHTALKTVTDEIKAVPQNAGAALNDVASATRAANNIVPDALNSVGKEIAGSAGDTFTDALTFQQRIQNEAGTTALSAVGNILEGRNILEANPLSLALASALQSAYDQHIESAKPLPENITAQLTQFFPTGVLAKARYVVGEVKISLPDGIILGNDIFSSDHNFAVTIDNLIIFAEPPNGSDKESVAHVGHELQHVIQYDRYGGIKGFSFAYTTKWDGVFKSRLETEAKSVQRYIFDTLMRKSIASR